MSLHHLRESLSLAGPAYLALSCFGLAATQPALAQTGGQATAPQRLGGVTVTDTAVEESYSVRQSASTKFTQPLLDTPQTVQIISKDLFLKQGATTLAEALRNSPGIGTFYAGENGNSTSGDAVYMRGFDTSNSIFVDGVRDIGSYSRDVFNIEQVEVEKGPAGTDNGRTAPTGAINMVSKQAKPDNALSGILSIGIDGQKRATVDLNQSLGSIPGAAFRLNMLWQDSDNPGRDHVRDRRIGLAPSVGLGLDGPTRAFLNLLYVKQDNLPDGFVPTIGLPGWEPQPGLGQLVGHPVDSRNFYGTRDDYDKVSAGMATLRIEHDFSDTLKLTNIARWGKTTQDYLLTAFMTTGGTVANPAAGNIHWGNPKDLSSYTLARNLATLKDVENEVLTDQLNLRADFATGAVEHSLSLGVEVAQEKQISYAQTATGTRPDASLYHPDWNDTGNISIARNGGISKGKTTSQSLYLFDTLKFFDGAFLVSGGARLDHYNTDYVQTAVCNNGTGRGAIACGSAPVGSVVPTADLSSKNTLFNWKLGAIYKPAANASLYVNYAISQQPPGGANFTLSAAAGNINNPNMQPQKAKTIEAGLKWEPVGEALALSMALFQTTVVNEINSSILDDLGNPTQTGEKRVKGIELSAVGSITDAWSVSAGYSHLDTKVTEGPAIASDGTPNLTYTPGDALSLWTSYRLPFGLEAAGGLRYNAGLHRGIDGAAGTPATTEGYTVVDAMVSYALTDNIGLRVNAYNLFDKAYVASINKSGYRYTPGLPRTVLFSADVRF